MSSLLGAWYRAGKVSVTKNSNAVVGSGTYWKSALLAVVAGDDFTLDGSKWYEVLAVDDDNALYLNGNFEEVTSLDTKYAIRRSTSGAILTGVAGQIALQFNQKQLLLDEIRIWLNSSNETESVTDSHGQTFQLITPAQMAVEHAARISDVDDLVVGAIDATAVMTQLLSSDGNVFRNNTGAVKTITAHTYINGLVPADISQYKYRWTSQGQQIYVSPAGDFVQTSPSIGLYAANGEDAQGLNFQSIIIDPNDVANGSGLNINCQVSNI